MEEALASPTALEEALAAPILRAIAAGLSEDPGVARAALIRLLERRSDFGAWRHALDALLGEVGLYPYVDEPEALGATELVAYEFHKPTSSSEFVFHRAQADVYRDIMAGDNVVLSAPTSFGKTAIIHEVISTRKFNNIVFVVPTIALLDETRRKLQRHQDYYRIITQVSQNRAERNILVLTPERVNDREDLGSTDFFVVDEFYKMGTKLRSDDRASPLNTAFYKLWKTGAQFCMLGPNIDAISFGFVESFKCKFIRKDTTTVVTDKILLPPGERLTQLRDLLANADGPTMVFCKSPDSANFLAKELLEGKGHFSAGRETQDLADWLAQNFHPEWTLVKALQNGIGIHHGRVPRAIQQAQVRLFDNENLPVMICTSTIIEGVNTAAKNVVVWDNTLNKKDLDFFTYSNIKGRSGRMFRHFVGRVYLFEEPPEPSNLEVDLPVHDQTATSPLEMLLQMDAAHLKEQSVQRLKEVADHPVVTLEFARRYKDVDPVAMQTAADALLNLSKEDWNELLWTSFPTKEQLVQVANLIWNHLAPTSSPHGIRTAKELASVVNQARAGKSLTSLIRWRLDHHNASPDEIIENALDQYRTWLTLRFPRFLRVLDGLQREVARFQGRSSGDYRFFASKFESFFLPPGIFALDEYGVPVQLAERLVPYLSGGENVDDVLNQLRTMNVDAMKLHPAEKEMLNHAIHGLQ
ncbi:MAG: DEAD/DEAH box helicase [Candidatus Thermoplasmatota archaeon]